MVPFYTRLSTGTRMWYLLHISMAISRKASLKYQGNQNIGDGQAVTYTLPPLKGNDHTSEPLIQNQSEISYIKGDLIKTVGIALGIMILELIVWWRLR